MTVLSLLALLHRHRMVRIYDENGILVHIGHMEDVRKVVMSLGEDNLPVVSVVEFADTTVFQLGGRGSKCANLGTQESSLPSENW